MKRLEIAARLRALADRIEADATAQAICEELLDIDSIVRLNLSDKFREFRDDVQRVRDECGERHEEIAAMLDDALNEHAA